MATSPTSKSALTSGAAKDDTIGDHGFTFTIQDLLANDPGGAAKVDVTKQFFFGDSAADQGEVGQKAYLDAHGITDLGGGVYHIDSDAIDFNYLVQIGNKGTWSQAHVDVVDRPDAPTPVDTHHAGDPLFSEDFDTYATTDNLGHGTWSEVNLGRGPTDGPSPYHGWAVMGQDNQWHGVSGEVVQGTADMQGSIQASSGEFWLDTQNSPGGIDITNWFHDPTGGQFQLSFDLGIHDFGDTPMTETAHDATFQVKVDGNVVANLSYQDVLNNAHGATDQMGHFDFVVDGGNAAADHTISFVDTTPHQDGYVGFALDTIQVHDWLII